MIILNCLAISDHFIEYPYWEYRCKGWTKVKSARRNMYLVFAKDVQKLDLPSLAHYPPLSLCRKD